jgi:hypothetical protein
VTNKNFPVNHYWSDENNAEAMIADQIKALKKGRRNRRAMLYNADWLRTQKGLEAFLALEPLMEMSDVPRLALFDELWNATTDATYPNWLAIDGVDGDDFKAIVMTMNLCLAARRCGPLGGKVTHWGRRRLKNFRLSQTQRAHVSSIGSIKKLGEPF